jgi:hypothetical protein
MAITGNDAKLLFYARKYGVSFEETLTLGRLKLYTSVAVIAGLQSKFGTAEKDVKNITLKDAYSEPLFELLGAKKLDSMDVSNYENASLIHDLNNPIPDTLKNQYSVVIDGGTLEHIFNFPQAINNCMNMIKQGGHFIGITPANNLMGHGFYQFSPELYYRLFCPANGFRIKKMMITAAHPDGSFGDWYEVNDPAEVKSRVVLVNELPTYLMIIAERTTTVSILSTAPQQSDYADTWSKRTAQKNKNETLSKKIINMLVPAKIRDIYYAVRLKLNTGTLTTKDLGAINDQHYKKVEDQ